jgi:hypothetical protein
MPKVPGHVAQRYQLSTPWAWFQTGTAAVTGQAELVWSMK